MNNSNNISRRDFLYCVSAGALTMTGLPVSGADVPIATIKSGPGAHGLTRIGALKVKSAREIKASRIGIGMECLDRRMYLPEKTYGHLAALGAKWARLQTGWARCETKEGVYDFGWLDEVVDAVIAAGVQPWFNVGYGNKLYSPDAPHETAVGFVPLYEGDRGVKAWRNFMRALAEHFKDRVEYWEIWNEPNISSFWHPKHKSSPVEYTKLVAISAEAIKAVHPKAKIVAVISGTNPKFIEDTFKAGIGEFINAYSIHPYMRELVPEVDYPAVIGQLRDILCHYAPHVRLWQGECGAPSRGKNNHESSFMHLYNMNEVNQAKWLVRRLLLDLFMDLDLTSYFHLCDPMEIIYRTASGTHPPITSGVLNGKSYTRKVAFAAMQSITTLFDADTRPDPYYYCGLQPVAEGATLREPYTMLFRRHGTPMLAYYQATNVQDDITSVRVNVTLSCEGRQKKLADILRDPVLVDPLTQNVYAIPNFERPAGKGLFRATFRFDNLPCLDYPFLITDRTELKGLA